MAVTSTLRIAEYYSEAVARQLTTLVLTLSIMFPALLWSSGLIVQERVRGTLSRLERTPLSSLEFVVGKFAVAGLVSMLQASSVVLAAWALLARELLGAPPLSLWVVLAALGLGTTAMGLLVSAVVRTPEQTASIVALGTLVMIVLCGFVKPLEDLGRAALLAQVFPFTHGFQAFRAVLLGSSNWEGWLVKLLMESAVLLGLTVAAVQVRAVRRA
jgi:ABC-type multidrug transport system permease subunit